MEHPNIGPSQYVIFTPDHEDFLSEYDYSTRLTALGWHHDPAHAIRFGSCEEAQRVAEQIVANQTRPENAKYRILICTLEDIGDQYQVKSVYEIFAELRPNSQAN